jgi:hypothetical protein
LSFYDDELHLEVLGTEDVYHDQCTD